MLATSWLLVPARHALSELASKASSDATVAITEDFNITVKRMSDVTPGIMRRQAELLAFKTAEDFTESNSARPTSMAIR